jgi:hypothetical protein
MMPRAAADALNLEPRIGKNTRRTNFFTASAWIERLLEDQIYLPVVIIAWAWDSATVGDALIKFVIFPYIILLVHLVDLGFEVVKNHVVTFHVYL